MIARKYQGIVIDWPKLQAELKSVVEDLFPDAALVPVRDAAGHLVLGEPLTLAFAAAGALVGAGLVLVNRTK